MLYRPNDDAIGNHFEIYGYEGWPGLQEDDEGFLPCPDMDEDEEDENE